MSRMLKMKHLQKIVKSIKRKLKIPITELIFDSRIFLIPYLISSIFYNNFKLYDDIFLKEKKREREKKKSPNSYAVSTNVSVYDPKLQ